MDLTKGFGVGASLGIDTAADVAHGLVGFGLNQLASSINADRNYKYWKKQTDYEQKLALENWNRQNEYNAPKSQMQRYAEAGLNPNLIYGQQNTGGSIDLQGSSSVNTESAQRLEHIGFMNAYENAKQMRAQTSLIKQQTLTEANNTLMRGLEVVSKQIENKYKEIKEKGESETLYQELENLKALHDKIVEDTKKLTSDIAVNESTIDLNKSRKGLTDAQTADIPENAKDRRTQAKASASQASTAEKKRQDEKETSAVELTLKQMGIENEHEVAMIRAGIDKLKAETDAKRVNIEQLEHDYKYARDKFFDKIEEVTGIPSYILRTIDGDLQKKQENIMSLFGTLVRKGK